MAQSSDLNLQEIHDFLVSVAYDAGKMITGARRPRAGGTGVKMNCKGFFSSETSNPIGFSFLLYTADLSE